MSITGYIITGLIVTIVAILGIGAIYINYERKKYKRKLTEQEKQGPATTQSKAPKDKHNKQLRQNAMFLNIIISQTATASEPTANTPFIKTQRKYTRQNKRKEMI